MFWYNNFHVEFKIASGFGLVILESAETQTHFWSGQNQKKYHLANFWEPHVWEQKKELGLFDKAGLMTSIWNTLDPRWKGYHTSPGQVCTTILLRLVVEFLTVTGPKITY